MYASMNLTEASQTSEKVSKLLNYNYSHLRELVNRIFSQHMDMQLNNYTKTTWIELVPPPLSNFFFTNLPLICRRLI